jgi:Cdc6-like AAA superfamily ATPase
MEFDQDSWFLARCLHCLGPSPFWSPLPCREREIAFVSDFIRQAFSSGEPRILVVDGHKGTGKTSALCMAAAMSRFERHIKFIDCREDSLFIESGDRMLVILDDFDQATHAIGDVIEFYARQKASMIFVTRLDRGISRFPQEFCPSVVSFGKYTEEELFEILKEKISGFAKSVPIQILNKVARKAFESGGGVPAAVHNLAEILHGAVMDGKTVLDVDEDLPDSCLNRISMKGCVFGFDVE